MTDIETIRREVSCGGRYFDKLSNRRGLLRNIMNYDYDKIVFSILDVDIIEDRRVC